MTAPIRSRHHARLAKGLVRFSDTHALLDKQASLPKPEDGLARFATSTTLPRSRHGKPKPPQDSPPEPRFNFKQEILPQYKSAQQESHDRNTHCRVCGRSMPPRLINPPQRGEPTRFCSSDCKGVKALIRFDWPIHAAFLQCLSDQSKDRKRKGAMCGEVESKVSVPDGASGRDLSDLVRVGTRERVRRVARRAVVFGGLIDQARGLKVEVEAVGRDGKVLENVSTAKGEWGIREKTRGGAVHKTVRKEDWWV